MIHIGTAIHVNIHIGTAIHHIAHLSRWWPW